MSCHACCRDSVILLVLLIPIQIIFLSFFLSSSASSSSSSSRRSFPSLSLSLLPWVLICPNHHHVQKRLIPYRTKDPSKTHPSIHFSYPPPALQLGSVSGRRPPLSMHLAPARLFGCSRLHSPESWLCWVWAGQLPRPRRFDAE